MGAYFSRPIENLVNQATITVTAGTALSGYGTNRLANGNPAFPFKIAETSLDLLFSFGSPAVLPELAVLQHSNLTVEAHLQGNDTNSWGSPDIDESFGIPVFSVDGFATHPFLDLRDFDAKPFWRLHIVDNQDPIILGGLWLGHTLRSVSDSYLYAGLAPAGQGQTLIHTTGYGVELAYAQSTRREVIAGSFMATPTDLVALEGLVQSARYQARPFIFIPRDDVDDAWFVKFASDRFDKPPVAPDVFTIPFPIRQVSNGLPWIDPDTGEAPIPPVEEFAEGHLVTRGFGAGAIKYVVLRGFSPDA